MRLLLFDIDLTLVKTGGAGMRAMEAAFRSFTGHTGSVRHVRPDGKTDPIIVPELFRLNGHRLDPGDYEAFMNRYLENLDREQRKQTDWRLLPGVEALLARVGEAPDLFPALVTGNDERGARLKLAPFDLNRFFPVGAFASDSGDRARLPPIAVRRAERHYGRRFPPEKGIVIGDSEGDVACAAANGMACLAVTTGYATKEELQAAGPCRILPDLSDADAVLDLFRSGW